MRSDAQVPWKERRVKTATLLQMEATECGAASLGIVLAFFGQHVPLEKLREECGVSRDGSSAVAILKAARRRGMGATAYRKDLEELGELPLPQILFWNFNHFVVLEGAKKGRYYLNDPATGPRTVDRKTMDESFTGVVLSLQPGPDFAREGAPRSPWKPLLRRLRPSATASIFALLAGLAGVLPGILEPTFRQIFVDHILGGGQWNWSRPLIALLGLTALGAFVLSRLQLSALRSQEIALSVGGAGKFFAHLLHLPYMFFLQRSPGELGNRVGLNDQVAQKLSRDLSSAALATVAALFFGTMTFLYHPALGGVVLGATLCLGGSLALVQRPRADLNERMGMELGKFAGMALGGLHVIEAIKSFGGEDNQFLRQAGQLTKLENAAGALDAQDARIVPLLSTVTSLAMALTLYLGGMSVLEGTLTVGMVLGVQTLMLATLTPATNLTLLWSTFQDAQAGISRLEDVLNYPCPPPLPSLEEGGVKGIRTSVRLSGALEIAGVTFGYSPLSPPLLENFSLSLVSGSRVALVGASASGKSTVAKLVGGLLTPWSGSILLDGTPLSRIPRELLTSSLAVVDQDLMLFEGTVLDNVTLWDPTVSREQVVQACKDADIHEEIASRSGGYESLVEENGRNFSGGQKQRLEIARALVRNPSILILDEATSALDPPMEARIDRALRRRGCTCLIVAHRLSTIRDCDEIIVLDRGKVAERGTHEELVVLGGRYAALVEN